MAIPNLAPGYMNQVQASRARALEAQRRRDFERDENRKAMERGIAQAFLGAALDVGTGAAKTAASEALLKPERERKRAHETAMQKDRLDLQEYGYDASSVDATGAAIAKVTGYDDDLARDAIVGMRRALNPAAVRGAGKATPVAPGARPLAPTAGTTPPQRGDRRIGIVTDAKAPVEIGPPVAAADDGSLKRGGPPLMGPPVEAADQDRLKEAIRRATILGNRGAESPTPAVSEPALQKKAGFPSVVDTAPRRVARRGAEAPSGRVVPARQAPAAAPASAPAAAPYDSGYEEAPGGFNPQAEMRRSLRPTASEFASERDRKLFAREQAFRRGAEAKALATALKRQDELMKRRGERTEFWDEYARKQADSLWNNQDKLDAMQDASKALANSQFERGVINVSLREWLQAFPPEDRDRVRASLPENMQEVLRRGQSMIVERPVTPDMIKRYNQLFANAIARKTKKGRTGGGPPATALPNFQVTAVGDTSKTKQSTFDLGSPADLRVFRRNIGTLVPNGMAGDARTLVDGLLALTRKPTLTDGERAYVQTTHKKLASYVDDNNLTLAGSKERVAELVSKRLEERKAREKAARDAKSGEKETTTSIKDAARLAGGAWNEVRNARKSYAEELIESGNFSFGRKKDKKLTPAQIMGARPDDRDAMAAWRKARRIYKNGVKAREAQALDSWWSINGDAYKRVAPPGEGSFQKLKSRVGASGSSGAVKKSIQGLFDQSAVEPRDTGMQTASASVEDDAIAEMARLHREINALDISAAQKRRIFEARTRELEQRMKAPRRGGMVA